MISLTWLSNDRPPFNITSRACRSWTVKLWLDFYALATVIVDGVSVRCKRALVPKEVTDILSGFSSNLFDKNQR